jgi:phosphohistidine phosphatase
MQLFFVRHGLADRSAWEDDDFKRPLTPEGRAKIEESARRLRDIGFQPKRIVSSPLTRALQTAEILADVLELKGSLVVDERLDPRFDVTCLRALLAENPDADSLAFVGHEPSFSEVIGELIGGGMVVCKKGSVARVDLESPQSNHGELVWLLQPKILIR